MSPVEALEAARTAGIPVSVDGDYLVLESAAEPPVAVVDLLTEHKAGILAILRSGQAVGLAEERRQGHDWSAGDWQGYFGEKAGVSEFDHGLPRLQAEVLAFNCCVAEWLGRNPVYSPCDRCLLCAEADRPNNSLLPIGIAGAGEVWLHIGCSTAWCTARKAEAVADLAAMGIRSPAGSSP